MIRAQVETRIAPGLALSMFPLRINKFMSINNVEAFAPAHGLPITDLKATVPKVQAWLTVAALMPESGTNEKIQLTAAAVTPTAT